jgi:hypothetical protein
MLTRISYAAAGLAAVLLAAAPAAAQSIMTLNHVVTEGLPHADCMSRAGRTLQAAGFVYHDTTSEAQWAVTPDRAYMVAIYCLRSRDVAVLAATGADGSVTSTLVSRISAQWQQTQ